jgi:hypothetical protein
MFSSFESFIFDGNQNSNHSPTNKSVSDDDLDLFPTVKPLQSQSYSPMNSFAHSPNHPLSSARVTTTAPPQYTPPSHRTAAEYRELLLPRRIFDEKQPTSFRLARPGELMDEKGHPALLYDFWKTPSEALDEFGIGVSLYFRILRILILVFLLCGFISIIAMTQNKQNQITTNYLSTIGSNQGNCHEIMTSSATQELSETFSTSSSSSSFSKTLKQFKFSNSTRHLDVITEEERQREEEEGEEEEGGGGRRKIRYLLSSHLISTDQTNSTSTPKRYLVYTPFRIIGSVYGASVNDLRFYRQGISDIIITSLLVLFTAVAGVAMKHQIQKIDISQQTTKDYSVVVANPPLGVDDPQVTISRPSSLTSSLLLPSGVL